MSSYFMFWNFVVYNNESEPNRFVGARNLLHAEADELLTQTVVAWWSEGPNRGYVTGNRWRGQTPWTDVDGVGHTGTYFTSARYGSPAPVDLPINAGFRNGSVQRFVGSNLREHKYPGLHGVLSFYFYDPDLR